jgi:Protein of unknown function (DUF2975)
MTTDQHTASAVKPASAALAAVPFILRLLIILNWVYGGVIVALLILSATLGWPRFEPSPENHRLLLGMRGVAVLGLISVPLHLILLRRLLAIVESVRVGDPFIGANASRLQTIAWMLLWLQLLGVAVAVIARTVTTEAHPFRVHSGFSTGGWLAVILVFVLARVFSEGARMRDELEGTV